MKTEVVVDRREDLNAYVLKVHVDDMIRNEIRRLNRRAEEAERREANAREKRRERLARMRRKVRK